MENTRQEIPVTRKRIVARVLLSMSAYISQLRQRPCQKVNSRSQIRPLSGYDFTPMSIHLGYVHKLVRYPVKSMAGVETNSAVLGWHGLAGDRRYAVRRQIGRAHV